MPIAVVKGSSFASLYPSGLRPFGDVDLLCAPSAIPPLTNVLTAHGFKCINSNASHLEDAWVHRENNYLMIEVHTDLVHLPRMRAAFSLTYDDLEGNSETPSALLAVAVMHGALHYFAWLRHVIDVCQAARALTTSDEETRFETIADRTGARFPAIIGLMLAHRLFGGVRCLEIARALGSLRSFRFERILIEGAVISAPMEGRIVYNGWRRFVFRELLRHGALSGLQEATQKQG